MEADAEDPLPDLRLQYLCAALATVLGITRPDAAGKPGGWRLSDFALPWRPSWDSSPVGRPPDPLPAAPPQPALETDRGQSPRASLESVSLLDLPAEFRDALDDPDAALLGEPGAGGAMSPEQTRAYLNAMLGLYGIRDRTEE
jgi:hypothetical protein